MMVTSSQPSSPHELRICVVVWIISGVVAYSQRISDPSFRCFIGSLGNLESMSKWLSRFTPRVGSWIGLGLVSGLAGVMVAVMLTPIMAISGVTLKNTIGVFDTIPDFVALDQLAQTNEIYAQNDADPANGYVKIASVYWQNREEVGWKDVSQFLKDAAVAGEDRRFYQHRGVDLQGVIRAALGNAVSGGVQSGQRCCSAAWSSSAGRRQARANAASKAHSGTDKAASAAASR